MLWLRTRSSYSPHKNTHAILLTVSTRGSGYRPWVVTVQPIQPIQHETQTAKGLRRHLVPLGFNPDYLWIICPICLIGIQASLCLFTCLCWVDVCLPSRWKKLLLSGSGVVPLLHHPFCYCLLHILFILPGIGAPCGDARIQSEVGALRPRPEAECKSQERANHYPTLWLLQEGADSWRCSLDIFTHGKTKQEDDSQMNRTADK